MKVLVVGGGGREHALAWAFSQQATVLCAPGNPGTAQVATNLPVAVTDQAGIVDAAREHEIDLAVIGPEGPLADGLADRLSAAGLPAFGPSARAARIEASKAYAKQIMERAGVPCAPSQSFTNEREALRYIDAHSEPLVVKASGLAAGKGAIVCEGRSEATKAAREMFAGRFGSAGREIVVEEFLSGEELSVLALTDGEQVLILPPSQDHKRLGESDTGPNTGGMGAYAPVSLAGDVLLDTIRTTILLPVLGALATDGATYRGVLYAGLMISDSGVPSVVEFNCRFGDPEAQVVLPVVRDGILAHLWAIAASEAWRPERKTAPHRGAAVTTVLAAPGYPASPRKGAAISLPAPLPDDTLLFHAGTSLDDDGVLRTGGGRVLCATGVGVDIVGASAASQRLAEAIEFDGKVFRRDIAWREVARAGAA